jgi:hypothetical protein
MMQVAEKGDAKLCDTLSESYKKNCQSSLLLQVAITSGDTTKCDALRPFYESTDSGSIAVNMDRVDQCKNDVIIRKQNAKLSDCDALKK